MLKQMVDKVVASGANVLLSQKGIDDIAQHYLAKKGILAARRAKGRHKLTVSDEGSINSK